MKNKALGKYLLIGIGIIVIIWVMYHIFTGHYFDREVRFCKDMRDLESYCVGGLAVKRNNPNLCTDLYNAHFNSLNLAYCITTYAEYTGDQKSCDLISAKSIKGTEINDWDIRNCYAKAWKKQNK